MCGSWTCKLNVYIDTYIIIYTHKHIIYREQNHISESVLEDYRRQKKENVKRMKNSEAAHLYVKIMYSTISY
jgi:hypothetical protein